MNEFEMHGEKVNIKAELVCNMKTSSRDGLPCRHYVRAEPKQPGFCALPSRFRCEEALKHYLPALSYSAIRDFMSCKWRYYLHYIKGIKSYPHTLPDSMKAGALWDRYMNDGEWSDDWLSVYKPSSELQAKLQALMRAFLDLEIEIPTNLLLDAQYKVSYAIGENQIIGYVDRAYVDHITEMKLTSNPDFYTHLEVISHQVGTYLLANEQWEFVTMEIIRLPQLKTGKGKYSEESPEAYQERIYQDIISRPSHYFLGWNRESRTFGKRFWRSEFDLEEIWRVYRWAFMELEDTIRRGASYKNTLSCFVPTQCLYHPICKTGVISDELYRHRDKPSRKEVY